MVDEQNDHEVVHHNERNPFRPFWIALGVIIGLALLWILFSYIYVGTRNDNNNNNQEQEEIIPETPTQPNTQPTPTPQTQ